MSPVLFARLFLVFVLMICFFVVYTVYLIRKYDFIQENKQKILNAYSDFFTIYHRDTYFSKKEFHQWLREQSGIQPIISDYKLHIDALKRFTKNSKEQNEILQSYVNIFLVPKDYDDVINYLYNLFEDGDSVIESRNEAWVTSELEQYKFFFDNQDGNSRTQSQRRAIVVDEANNLAIAGAGTGKTLTIVSKIGYLLDKKLAKPDEILVLAYANKAKEELEERVRKLYSVDIDIRTFHSFGLEIIGKATGLKPPVSSLAFDESQLLKALEGFIKKRMNNLDFANTLNNYFLFYLNPVENDLEFSTREEYDDYLNNIEKRTLQGEKVKSLAELSLANFFFMKNVEYSYETEYPINTATENRRPYTPDFYLPDHQIWIEHIGIDRSCNTAPKVDRWDYLDSWYWKRKIHKENSTELLETYSYQYLEGDMIDNLVPQLEVRGVNFTKRTEDQMFDSLKKLGETSHFVRLLSKFLHLYKANSLNLTQIRAKASRYLYSKRYLAFLDIFEPILTDYQDLLLGSNQIDFNDMINDATRLIKNGEYQSNFKYILVDEFQDISQSRYRMLKTLRDQNWRTKIFCVGDDWQSIYRFTGSDLSIMTNFRRFFDPCEISFLNESFRFKENIANFSSSFIMKNDAQYPKQIISEPSSETGIKLIWYDELGEALNQALDDIENKSPGSTVFLLSRYGQQYYESLNDIAQNGSENRNLNIKHHTLHSSKGKQADYIVLFGLQSGRFGFPSEIEDDPVLNLVLSEDDRYPNAEERRVFYVGVTRTKNSVYLLANRNRISHFISEIISDETDIEILNKPPQLFRCSECKKGVINRIDWNEDVFFSCSRYPVCKYRPKKCPVCNDGFLYLVSPNDDSYRCSNESCSYSPKKCPECGGILLRRTGNPDFYGCSNYFSKNCLYKEELETIDDVITK